MPRKSPTFNAALEPLEGTLPREVAAAVGDVVMRHTYLDWVLGQVMYDLMGISIKQGRVIMKMPRPKVYIAAVKELYEFHNLGASYDFDELGARLERADCALRELTRSVYMRDTSSRKV